jgi:hypothetical protein
MVHAQDNRMESFRSAFTNAVSPWAAQGAGRGRPLLAHATWIAAESPQPAGRGLGAKSPVRGVYAANAPKYGG